MIRKYRIGVQHLKEPYRTLVSKLLEALLEVWGPRLVSLVVFGSVARGDARPDSDIDLLIVGRGLPRSRFRRQELFEEAEEKLEKLRNELWSRGFSIEFSPIILDIDEARKHRPLYLDTVEDAVIVYDSEGFMQHILDELAEKLRELGAERVWIGRRWYWILKRHYVLGEAIEL